MNFFAKILLGLFFLLSLPLSLFSLENTFEDSFYPLTILNSDLPPLEKAVQLLLEKSIFWEEQLQATKHLEKENELYWLSWLPSLELEYAYQSRKEIEQKNQYQSAFTIHLKQPIPLGWEFFYELKSQKRKMAQTKEGEKKLLKQIHFEMENRYLQLFQMEEEYNYLVKQNLFWEQIHRIAEKRKEFQQIKEMDYQSILINWEANKIKEKSSLLHLQSEFKSLLLSIGEEKTDCRLPLFLHQNELFERYKEKNLKKEWILFQKDHHPEWKELSWNKENLEDQLIVGGLTFLPRLEYQMEWNLVDYDGYRLINKPQSGFKIFFQLPGIQFETQWSEKKLPYEKTQSTIGKSRLNGNQWNQVATLVRTKEMLIGMEKKLTLLKKRLSIEMLTNLEKIENLKKEIINEIAQYENKKKEQEIYRILYEKGEIDLYRLSDGEKESFALLAQIGEMRFFYFKSLFELAAQCDCNIKELFEERL